MRISTWNINSIRSRLPRVLEFLCRSNVDVLAMQEIKCRVSQFPVEAFLASGYQVFVNGLNQWNGVAIAVRADLDAQVLGTEFSGKIPQPPFGKPPVVEPRALGVRVAGIECWSLYVPNGREVDNPHFAYKLAWLEALRSHAHTLLAANPTALGLFMGDFNIAPCDEDVWDIHEFAGATHVSVPEREAFARLLQSDTLAQAVSLDETAISRIGTDSTNCGGLVEVTRQFAPGWTYWDYQKARWRRNQGMKIDFALATPNLADKITGAFIGREERDGEKPSDHVPVVLEL
ncbi:exodeoxyribonuclease III [Mobiluncus mulieris]|uniref:Exodeoxyribonuclease III n=1 Tax=Mobiluncus mulieris TaxID=2052 RepID=A0A378PBC8_9ACTO|nr:exodeoxyribonuclease III [Mobiluncus mulieris]MCU9969062.1 exodeoxyribonuclease III [Mobiluncus mulieris]MCU9973551.1 exodeoxyribonuclease III [Mobiluncus mulieris]MCV0009484.1 exodeoxyribonuclease III [Mobiluncus mulieris]NMW64262.1 exodeoxyribonuclease III [Mobiluncus mulieris]NMW75319.1 exodeoxyribonuclease III [Mobiluncus mulieris]